VGGREGRVERGDVLVCLGKEFVPVAQAARHGAQVDEVEEVRGPGPGLLGVVDFEFHVGRDPGYVSGGVCVSMCA
jgi:hypothetical protein